MSRPPSALAGIALVSSHAPDRWSMAGILMIAVGGAAGAWLMVRESRIVFEPAES